MNPTQLSLTYSESAQLLPVLALTVCSSAERRALLIKGESANFHGIRTRRTSADVDVLLDPAHFADAVNALRAAGWRLKGGDRTLRLRHSDGVTLVNPLWPQPIDLHRRFTGFTAPDHAVFEALWADRVHITIAGQPVVSAGAATACLIQALHELRDQTSLTRDEFSQAVEWLKAADRDTRSQVVALAQVTGAAITAQPLFGACNLEILAGSNVSTARARAFRRRTVRGQNFVTVYLAALTSRPFWVWPWLIVRFVFGRRASLAVQYPEATHGMRGLWLARWHRVRDAIRLLPEAIRLFWRTR